MRRFWEKVRRGGDGCWEWTGAARRGYGAFWFAGRTIAAHRFAYEFVFGPIPSGMEPDHLCRNKVCVRPSHLELVTHRENTRRGKGFAGDNARQTRCPQGHEYDRIYGGRRHCRRCRAEANRRWRTRQTA